jgi:hypothetical protein
MDPKIHDPEYAVGNGRYVGQPGVIIEGHKNYRKALVALDPRAEKALRQYTDILLKAQEQCTRMDDLNCCREVIFQIERRKQLITEDPIKIIPSEREQLSEQYELDPELARKANEDDPEVELTSEPSK